LGRSEAIHCLEGSPLIGMAMIWDPLLMLKAVDGGPVSITPLP
jgi:hypothetical protein